MTAYVIIKFTINIPMWDITSRLTDPTCLFRQMEELSIDGVTRVGKETLFTRNRILLGTLYPCTWYINTELQQDAVNIYEKFRSQYQWKDLGDIYIGPNTQNERSAVPNYEVSNYSLTVGY